MKKTALVVLTDGFEEIEAITPIDLLRRAETEVTIASASGSLEVTGKTGVVLRAETLLDGCLETEHDLLVLPGGPGIFSLREDNRVLDLIRRRVKGRLPVAAICAAPLLLKDAGVLGGKSHTAHGAVSDELPDMQDTAVVEDLPFITSRGAGTAFAFGLACVRLLHGEEVARRVADETHAD
jgi:4-methyl-5(b-hydroxyethyl)-thiazole monophosphate biosynthesis